MSDGLAFMGTYAGTMYAWDADTGEERWLFKTGQPIGHSPTAANGVLYFSSMNRKLYAVDVTSAKVRWTFACDEGVWSSPVVTGGLVMSGARDGIFYGVDAASGKLKWKFQTGAPILYTGGLHNPLTPPCVNRATGEVLTQVRSAYGTWDGGGEVRPFTGFGKLDLQTGRVELLEHSYKSKEPGRPPGAKDMPWGSFNYIGDETQTLSCSPEFLLSNHQGFIGAFNWQARTIANLFGKRDSYGGFYGAANFGWENKGGYEKAAAANAPYGLVNEWHGPARAIVSAVGKKVYFPVGSQVICLEGK